MREVVLRFCCDEDGYEVRFNGVVVGSFIVPDELEKDITSLEFTDLDSFGKRISEALYVACPPLVELIRGLRDQNIRFVLEFHDGTEDLLNFPWEFIRHPDFAVPLSLEFSFLRRFGEDIELEPLRDRPLKVLVLICEPITLAEFNGRRFHDVIVERARRLSEEGLIQLDFLKCPSTPSEFGRRILEDCPDVVHFIGHGDVGVLCFEDENGDYTTVKADRFYALFSGAKKPRVVMLTACFSGAVAGKDLVSGTATSLIKAGVPSVFAMQLPILVESAYELIGDLYTSFLSRNFDVLVKDLRASRFFAERVYSPAQWGIPVFYNQCKKERLFEGISEGEGYVKEWLPVSPDYGLPKLGLFVGRQDYLLKMNRDFRENNVVILSGLSGIGKSALAGKFCHWHKSRGSFPGGIVWIDLRLGEEVKLDYETVLEKIALALNISKENIINRLRSMPALLIFDSYEEIRKDNKLANFLVKLPTNSKAILTSIKPVDFGKTIRIEEMEEKDAVEYFYRRALNAGWTGTGEEYIPKICRELGYWPLCIELIAPTAKKYPLKDLLEQVREDLQVIAAERSYLPEHQWSIEMALRVSYRSLKPMEQRLLAITSIFRGRFYHKSLARISDLSEADSLNLLGNLYDSGLLKFDGERYYLHNIVQRFSSERLEKDFREKEKYEERFAEFFLALVGASIRMVVRDETSRAAVNMALKLSPNLILAQEILFKKGKINEAFNFSMALDILFDRAGLWQSRIKIMQLVLEEAKYRENKALSSEAYSRLGLAYDDLGLINEGLCNLQKSIEINRELGDRLGEAKDLGNIGNVLFMMKRYEEAFICSIQSVFQLHEMNAPEEEIKGFLKKHYSIFKGR